MFCSIDKVNSALAAFKCGEIIISSDDDTFESENNLLLPAFRCTSQQMAFVIRHSSGIVCAPVSSKEARRLDLRPMVSTAESVGGVVFTQSIDARAKLTTGISAEERTKTVVQMADTTCGPKDFVRPGHVFPVITQEGGVLFKSGHAEACIDLCRLARFPEVGVMAQLVNDDGTVMRGEALNAFVRKHKFQQLSVSDLIAYRQTKEKLVRRIGEFPVQSQIGILKGYAFVTPFDPQYHLAFLYGDVSGTGIPARLHRADLINEVFAGAKLIDTVLKKFQQEGRGVLVYLRDGTAGVPVTPIPSDKGNIQLARVAQWREIGLGAQILNDLNIQSIRLLSSAKKTYVGLDGFGINIIATEPIEL